MRIFLCSILVVLASVISVPSRAAVPVSAEISRVVLFPEGALISRSGKAKVDAGVIELHIPIDSFFVDIDSVSAKVFGEGELYSVQYKVIPLPEPSQDNIRALKEKLRQIAYRRQALVARRVVIKKQKEFLQGVVDFSGIQIPREMKTEYPKIEKFKDTVSFIGSSYAALDKEDAGLHEQLDALDEEISAVKQELEALGGAADKAQKVIEVVFDSKRAQNISVEASYLVGNASWQPLYKIEVPSSLSGVSLTMFSKVRQKTGEDWDGVTLSVSNVIPLRGVGLPRILPWYLDVRLPRMRAKEEYEPYHLKNLKREGKVFGAGKYAAVSDEIAPQEAVFASAVKKELPFSFEYELPRKLTIESRKKETLLPLFSKTLKGDFFYLAVPKINPLTFMVCRTTADKELLSGFLNVYFDGRFVGKTYLEEKKPGEDFEVNVGAARDIKVVRRKIKDTVDETFFGKIERKTVRRQLEYTIVAENTKDIPVLVKIIDAVPVSRTDKIEVKDVHLSPRPSKKDYRDHEGVMLWEFTLPAHREKKVTMGFTVTYPNDKPVSGL